MNIMEEFRGDVVRVLSRQVPRRLAEAGLERPPENIGSDLAYPCFSLARRRKAKPAEIAREISRKLRPSGLAGGVNFYGPYINFYLDWKKAAGALLKGITKEGGRYGRAPRKPVKKIMVEYAHPNTHKAFHIGHVRNICLGESLCRILEASGCDVVRANYQGDIGPHVAKCLWGFTKIHKGRAPQKERGRWLGRVYREASGRIARSRKAEKEMREINSMLYARDSRIMPVWKKTRQWSIDYFDGIYRDFGARFDRLYFESEVEAGGLKMSEGLARKGLARVSDGAIIINMERQGLGVFVLVTRDKTPLYHAKDLALAELQMREYMPDRIVHVVGSEQTLYFRQLFRLLKLMKWRHVDRESHLRYELINLGSGKKMKSREGEIILYDELREKILKLARKEARSKNPGLSVRKLDKTASLVGMGALKYTMLSKSPEKVIVFDWDRMLSFEGDTGPYIQYSHARAKSILRKAGSSPARLDPKALADDREVALMRHLAEFPDAVQRAAMDMRPHYIAGYALDLATRFNEFYQAVPVLKAGQGARPARLALVRATAQVLSNALNLLGIEAPERM
jgi:arginyl-tRNA synthetase